jgi:hypothetical protein
LNDTNYVQTETLSSASLMSCISVSDFILAPPHLDKHTHHTYLQTFSLGNDSKHNFQCPIHMKVTTHVQDCNELELIPWWQAPLHHRRYSIHHCSHCQSHLHWVRTEYSLGKECHTPHGEE